MNSVKRIMVDMSVNLIHHGHVRLLEKASEQWDLARRWNCEHWARLDKNPRDQDKLSWRLRREPLPTGIAAGMVSFVDDEDEENCLSEYYRLRGWSEQGIPV